MVRGCRLSWASASLQQTQRSVHNSYSCSCILIQSAGLSLKRSIFLHFCNYSRARECSPRRSERPEPCPRLLSPLTSTLSANLSNPSSASRSGENTRQSVSLLTFTSRHFVYILTSSAVLFWMTQRWTLFTEAIYEKARICSGACFSPSIFFQLYFPKRGFSFPSLFFLASSNSRIQ